MFQARRSSDQATQDFFAHDDGTFWSTPGAMGQPIGPWLNGATAYCAKWYDQSGAGNHAGQTNPALQPVVDYVNFLMDFTAQAGTCYLNLPTGTVPQKVAYTVTARHGVINNPSGGWFGGGNTSSNLANNFRRSNLAYTNYWWSNDFAAGAYAPGNTVTFKYDGSSRVYLYTNGAPITSRVMKTGWDGRAGNEFLGRTIYGGDLPLNGVLYFVCAFKSALTDDKRSAIEAGIYGKLR